MVYSYPESRWCDYYGNLIESDDCPCYNCFRCKILTQMHKGDFLSYYPESRSCLFVFQMISLTLSPGEARYGGPERHACVLRGIKIIAGMGMKRVKAWSVVLHRVTLTFVLRTDTGVYSVRRGMAYTRDPVFKSVFPCTGISTCIQHRGTGVYSVF